MLLSESLLSQVDTRVQWRGHRYFQEGRVVLGAIEEDYIEAHVKGSRRYFVSMEREPEKLYADCSCPYFEGGFACKHIWATILMADARHLLQPLSDERFIRLITDQESELESDFDDDNDIMNISPASLRSILQNKTLPNFKHVTQAAKKPTWKEIISTLAIHPHARSQQLLPSTEIIYQLNTKSSIDSHLLSLDILCRQMKKNGQWGKLKAFRQTRKIIKELENSADRHILTILAGTNDVSYGWSSYHYQETIPSHHLLHDEIRDLLLPLLCDTGRCSLAIGANEKPSPLQMDSGHPWIFRIEAIHDKPDSDYIIRGYLERNNERRELDAPALLLAGGWVFMNNHAARLDDANAFQWIKLLRREGQINVPHDEASEIPSILYSMASLPSITLPEELKYKEIRITPKCQLKILKPRHQGAISTLFACLIFDYDGILLPETQSGGSICMKEERSVIIRDMEAEGLARQTLTGMSMKQINYPNNAGQWEFHPRRLAEIVSTLMAQNWRVEAEGRLYKTTGTFNINVTSGMDWFELHASANFDGVSANLPTLLKALKNKEQTILLSDGSIGMLPEEWLTKYGVLAALGTITKDHVRFQKNQAGFLDALLAAQPDATCDEVFHKLRTELNSFESIKPANPASTFTGTLRSYQKDGLGWLGFLQKFNFGGCLADDMGLGKTVQVLAMLEARRKKRAAQKNQEERIQPSLVVVPRSLIFNWKNEIAKFTPKMRILDHSGLTRQRESPNFNNYDIVLTTYGTLRRDIAHLKDISFDYVILDEAQAIKNAQAHTSKAARLLRCSYRLAMSGTPVQNHLGELWSLFEFLNPGMLGKSTVFNLTEAAGKNPSEETRSILSRALRPFILRRTKSQVAKDLPKRTEETLYCELDKKQRKLYDELRNHYRLSLTTKIKNDGMNKSKIMILEALLRLRQAACHPGLIDPKRSKESSAKLENLLPQIGEVMDEGHKVLVFSQFTSFLAIVRQRLDAEGTRYEYLDGQTRDRENRVSTFQNDPDCRLFLISLKAGGLGLNLTAAEYVYLLDPWWNPAVEMQAIDRAHRIGQKANVFAYRLIAKDTVEEKVLELQKTKKELADSIINANSSLIRTLSREDLELLLG